MMSKDTEEFIADNKREIYVFGFIPQFILKSVLHGFIGHLL